MWLRPLAFLSVPYGLIQHTVGTFSCLQGNPLPSFALVTAEANWPHRVETNICFLPTQLMIWAAYGVLLLITVIVVVFTKLYVPPRRGTSVPHDTITPMRKRVMHLKTQEQSTLLFKVTRMFRSTWVCVGSVNLFYMALLWLAS